MEYNFNEIEKKWQQKWVENKTYKVMEDEDKKKFYVLNMFPYPSGAGLHVGHPLGYIASDIYARYKRLQGFNVLNPMGYDAYGLPAEQYAIQTGQHPAITTEKNIARYREQLDKIGFSFDWDREVRTCDPKYYHWTQWAFERMFASYYDNHLQKAQPIENLVKHFSKQGTEGLNVAQSEELSFTAAQWNAMNEEEQQKTLMNYRIAYLGETMVNWCPALGTVLANDEVVNGVSERGGYPVVQKKMKQWCLRVSAYAQRLLDGLNTLDWTDSLKETQRNWIGRSEGTEVVFKSLTPTGNETKEGEFTIFTTRADTMYGVSFMVLAPESELVESLTAEDQKAEVADYLAYVKKRTELERMSDRKVTGVFSGSYAINPFTGEQIPIWISEYVLAGYGTGAIMAVPAHDSRDYAFAKHFNLPIIPLIEGADVSEESFDAKEGIVMNSPSPLQLPHNGGERPQLDKQKIEAFKTAHPDRWDVLRENAKALRKHSTAEETLLWEHLRNKSIGYKIRRQHAIGDYIADFVCLPAHLVIEIDGGYHNNEEQKEADRTRTQYLNILGFKVIRFTNEEINNNLDSVINSIKETITAELATSPVGGGQEEALVLNGLTVKEAIAKTKKFVTEKQLGHVKVNYRLRDAIFSRQRYWGEPFPVYYKNGMPYMIPEECLPMELPEIDKYEPTETGEPPLGRAKNWAWNEAEKKVVSKDLIDEKTVFTLELNTMPGFAGSSAYYLRYMDPHDDEALVSKKAREYWQNVDLYVGGTEHATGHLIYSRFWNKFLFDYGYSFKEEPFQKLINQGMIQGRSNFVYRINTDDHSKAPVFVSLGQKDKYEVTPIHVDVNIVHGDILDIKAFKAWRPEYEDAEFIFEDGSQEQREGATYKCGWAVEKMSKSMFNVVNPDDIVEQYGADTLRLYEMFLGPVEASKPWDTNGIDGCHRFLRKFWKLYQGELTDAEPTKDNLKSVHKLIKKVTGDIENFSYNTAISAFMICLNELGQQKCSSKELLKQMVIVIAPFAPHIAEELWEQLGGKGSVCDAEWPAWNEDYLKESEVQLTISFNGKARFQKKFAAGASNEEIQKQVLEDEKSQQYLAGKNIVKVIIVPGRIVNIVLK